ncbi:glycosyltransferase family 4 protein [Lacticaseibacillus sp. 866-1]|uniref:glycosyltransferase family 4 protein n=1 Tax=Lacticaseibacillus sp. 866-1 TaxID=2799576 RepID=UPI001942D1AC|nr:glycosyltransferase family 4 protein [Lacticaseibacillus sp. 866-1]
MSNSHIHSDSSEPTQVLFLHGGAEMYGADKILLEIVSNLNREKFLPIVILPTAGILTKALIRENVEVQTLSFPVVRRKYFNALGIIKYAMEYFGASHKIGKIVRTRSIPIVHVNTTAVWEGVWLYLFTKARIVWHVHEIITHPRIVHKFVCFLLQHFSDEIIAVSNATKRHLVAGGVDEDKIHVIHNGINGSLVTDVKSVPASERPVSARVTVGMIGRVNAWKGQSDFLDAVLPVLGSTANAYAMIVGSAFEGEEWRERELDARISNLPIGIKERVSRQPFQSDVSKIYAQLDVFVLPSISPDPFPTVVLEAMANGLPVVAYKHGGVQEMVVENKTGILVEPHNTIELAAAVQRLVDDRELRIKMGESAEQRQKQYFELSAFVREVEAVYEGLM